MKLLKLWQKIGRQPIKTTQNQDAIAIIDGKKYPITHIEYDGGRFVGLVVDIYNEVNK